MAVETHDNDCDCACRTNMHPQCLRVMLDKARAEGAEAGSEAGFEAGYKQGRAESAIQAKQVLASWERAEACEAALKKSYSKLDETVRERDEALAKCRSMQAYFDEAQDRIGAALTRETVAERERDALQAELDRRGAWVSAAKTAADLRDKLHAIEACNASEIGERVMERLADRKRIGGALDPEKLAQAVIACLRYGDEQNNARIAWLVAVALHVPLHGGTDAKQA